MRWGFVNGYQQNVFPNHHYVSARLRHGQAAASILPSTCGAFVRPVSFEIGFTDLTVGISFSVENIYI